MNRGILEYLPSVTQLANCQPVCRPTEDKAEGLSMFNSPVTLREDLSRENKLSNLCLNGMVAGWPFKEVLVPVKQEHLLLVL